MYIAQFVPAKFILPIIIIMSTYLKSVSISITSGFYCLSINNIRIYI